ncbi:hypothetical protein G6F57_021323 [Rhizopus arrhizus]|nr:hypothetical protein G6F57_021323 [Rhizopus arrhizus]
MRRAGHRVVGRVDHHHVGGGDRFHHPAVGHLLLQLADAPLHFRAALAFLHFPAQLFTGHLQLAHPVPALVRGIDGGQHQHRAGGGQQQPQGEAQAVGDGGFQRVVDQPAQGVEAGPHHQPGGHADEGHAQ